MSDNYVLPIRPAPFADESLLGYLQRLARANFCERVHWISQRADFEPTQSSIGKADLEPLARLCAVGQRTLEQMCHRHIDDDRISFNGVPLPRELVRNTRQRLCGLCVADAGYHRQTWNLAFVHACHKHKVKLFDSCRECGEPLRWNRPSVTVCECGADLTKQLGEPISSDDAEALRAILGQFESLGQGPDEASTPLDLSAGDFINLILFLGRQSTYLQSGVPQRGRTLDRTDLAAVLRFGYQASLDWPHRFHDLLDSARGQQRHDHDAVSLTSQFGPTFRVIAKLHIRGWGALVRAAFRSYLKAHPDIPVVGVSAAVFADPNTDRAYVTAAEASEILGISVRSLLDQMTAASWKGIRTVGKDSVRRYLREDVERVANRRRDTINLKQLGERLGVPTTSVLRKIIESRIFTVVEADVLHDKRGVQVLSSEVAAFLQMLEASAGQGNGKDCMTLRAALRSCGEHGVDLPGFLAMLKRGDIRPVGKTTKGRGVYRYLFDRADLNSKLSALVEDRTGSVSAATAAKRLTVHVSAVYDLVKLGLLESCSLAPPGPKGLRITRSSIERFQEEYATPSILARELETDPRVLKPALRKPQIAGQIVAKVGVREVPIYPRWVLSTLP